ncbi:MAG: DUF1405 domain-containing protein [Candidatus Hodarchaeales archaeon]|jgi:uncharacterized membrane protein YpjA
MGFSLEKSLQEDYTLLSLLYQPAVKYPLAGLNILGGILVIYTNFWRQMKTTHPIWWFFLPDCAISAFLVAITLLKPKKRGQVVQIIAAMSCLKSGISYLVLAYYKPSYLSPPTSLIGHLGLLAEGIVLMVLLSGLEVPQAVSGMGWTIFDEILDLTTPSRPYPMDYVPTEVVIVAWIILDVFLAAWTYNLLRKSAFDQKIPCTANNLS